MRAIFLSYRRQDSADICDRLSDSLSRHYGGGRIFRDTTTIMAGSEFPLALRQALEDCRAIIVVIGPGWLSARDMYARRRLDDSSDWVRIEVATGLREGKLVVPVLVRGASLPAPQELPEDLRPLARLQPVVVRSGPEFPGDITGVYRALGRATSGGPPHVGLLICGALTLLALMAFMIAVAAPALAGVETFTIVANTHLVEVAIALELLRVVASRRWIWLAAPVASVALQLAGYAAGIFSLIIILFTLCALPLVMGALGPYSSMRPLGMKTRLPPRMIGVGVVALSAVALAIGSALSLAGALDLWRFAASVSGLPLTALVLLSLGPLLLAGLLMLSGDLIARRWVSFLVWLLAGVVYGPIVALMVRANLFPVFLITFECALLGMGWWIARQPRHANRAPHSGQSPVERSLVQESRR
ncbi:MAG TPA: toll/interleukin-1 receptor domain-containing protein [Ktedonobacterales bacterium]